LRTEVVRGVRPTKRNKIMNMWKDCVLWNKKKEYTNRRIQESFSSLCN
jgi:hypothetical protein